MAVAPPFNLHRWIADNRSKLQPPVGNACLYDEGGFLVMVIGGPNARTDYHINCSEELFYQLQGDIVVRIMESGTPRDIPIKEGEIFLLPAGVPHSPQRGPNTVGLVVEFPRLKEVDHHLRWYCKSCDAEVHDEAFRPKDLGKQIKEMLGKVGADESLRKCPKCGTVNC